MPRISVSADRFPKRTVPDEGGKGHQRLRVISCRCGAEAVVSANGQEKDWPVEAIAKKFARLGWTIGQSVAKDRCPACSLAPPKARTPKPPITIEPKGEPMPVLEPVPELPRQPSREDRRRIQDLLDRHYDLDKQRYDGERTDKSVAAELDVPAAWVRELRDMLYGPERNEAADIRAQELKQVIQQHAALIVRVEKHAQDSMALMDEAEALRAKIEALAA